MSVRLSAKAAVAANNPHMLTKSVEQVKRRFSLTSSDASAVVKLARKVFNDPEGKVRRKTILARILRRREHENPGLLTWASGGASVRKTAARFGLAKASVELVKKQVFEYAELCHVSVQRAVTDLTT